MLPSSSADVIRAFGITTWTTTTTSDVNHFNPVSKRCPLSNTPVTFLANLRQLPRRIGTGFPTAARRPSAGVSPGPSATVRMNNRTATVRKRSSVVSHSPESQHPQLSRAHTHTGIHEPYKTHLSWRPLDDPRQNLKSFRSFRFQNLVVSFWRTSRNSVRALSRRVPE